MEADLQNVAKEAMQRDKVAGYLAVDQQGLCLAAEGVATESNAALIASISQLASRLEPGNTPVLQIDSSNWLVIIDIF